MQPKNFSMGCKQQPEEPEEIAVDGIVLEDSGSELIGKATRVGPGLYQCLANFRGALVRMEVRVTRFKKDGQVDVKKA